MNRKLIRPNMGEIKGKMGRASAPRAAGSAPAGSSGNGGPGPSGNSSSPNTITIPQGSSSARRRIAPPEQTNAESFYYIKQMQGKTPMVIVLLDGEKIRGSIEWYDKHCLKIHCPKEPNILLPKHSIKYMYKQEEEQRARRIRGAKKEDREPETTAIAAIDAQLYD